MSEVAKNRNVFLGMPGYGSVTADAARGFWRASGGRSAVHYYYMQSSLLAQGFNGIWCAALNTQREGKPVDYFAMQHSDIEPMDGWLDVLIDELEAKKLDVLGVASPIKDNKGMTSIALGDPNDNWRVKCRLSLDEIHKLPVTFTSEDVGHQLLLNTGLWVCRFDPAWNTKLHFEINDRIVFDTQRQAYVAQCEPEDWFFSRLCHELDLNIGCTRLIPLNHRGSATFTNAVPYGEKFDEMYIEKSLIADPGKGFRFPADVSGWLTRPEGRKLAEVSKGKHVLEIGSYCGRSTICIAQTAKAVVSIDPHDGRGTASPVNTYDTFRANLKRYGLDNVRSSDGTDLDPDNLFDVIFIDGSHAYEDVQSDIFRSLEYLKNDGLVCFHDYRSPCDPGVTQAVDEFISAGAELISLTDTLAVVRPPAAIPMEI